MPRPLSMRPRWLRSAAVVTYRSPYRPSQASPKASMAKAKALSAPGVARLRADPPGGDGDRDEDGDSDGDSDGEHRSSTACALLEHCSGTASACCEASLLPPCSGREGASAGLLCLVSAALRPRSEAASFCSRARCSSRRSRPWEIWPVMASRAKNRWMTLQTVWKVDESMPAIRANRAVSLGREPPRFQRFMRIRRYAPCSSVVRSVVSAR